MKQPIIHSLFIAVFAWVFGSGPSLDAQAGGVQWGSNVPAHVRCDEQLLAYYDAAREQLGIEHLRLDVLDSVNEEGVFGKGTFAKIRALARHRDIKSPKLSLLKRSVELFLDAKNHRDDLLIGTVSGRLQKNLCSATYYPCNAQRFGMGVVDQETAREELEQRTVSMGELADPPNSPLDFILIAPYVAMPNRSDLVFNWQGTTYLFDEPSFDAAVILHELTHYLDEKRVTRWVNANLQLLKEGKPADELFVNGSTVSYAEDLAQVTDASNVTVDMGMLLIYYEGRGHKVGMQTQLLSLAPAPAKPAVRPGTPPARRQALSDRFLQDLSPLKKPSWQKADEASIREFQTRKAWKSINNSLAKRWLQNGVPGWAGPVNDKNLFEVSDALAAIMDATILRAQTP